MRHLGTYLFVSDVDKSLEFYQLLGLDVEKVSDLLGRGFLAGETVLEFGSAELTSSYDQQYVTPSEISKGTLNFELESSDDVDEKFLQMRAAGYQPWLAPIDALWQARFAIVLDPDGNQVGLHGPRDLGADRSREKGST